MKQKYTDMLALNVADCPVLRMGAASMLYRDAKGKVVARFELPANSVEYVDVKPGTIGATMLDWLCASPKPAAAPDVSGSGFSLQVSAVPMRHSSQEMQT